MFAFKIKKKKKSNFLFYFTISLVLILSAIFGYLYFQLYKKYELTQKELKSKELLVNELQRTLKLQDKKLSQKEKTIDLLKKESQRVDEDGFSEIEDYLYSLEFEKKRCEEKKLLVPKDDLKENTQTKNQNFSKHKIVKKKYKIPKLAIIIDDVAFRHEVRDIKKIPFKVTPSFFPPSKRHPDTYKFAKDFKYYMIHLPLQAYHFSRVEKETLNINDSPKKMEYIIQKIRKFFPKAVYINNHTGSKFTSDKKAMEELFKILKKYRFKFLDSRTSINSKALIVAREFNETIFSRDIFLDNIANERYIKKQLLKAVKLAKRRGYAIAIGHPRRDTLKALRDSKNLLKGVDVVYINEL